MRFFLYILCVTSFVLGCSKNDTDEVDPDSEDQNYIELRAKVISQVSSQTEGRFSSLEEKLDSLEKAIQAWDTSQSDSDLDASKLAFKEAILAWQKIEASLHVPFDSSVVWEIGRDDIYSWPLSNFCRIDQELVAKTYEQKENFENLLVNAIGLDAVEYLLWHSGENECPPQSTINTSGDWAAITDLQKRRSAYTLAAVDLVKSHTTTLKTSSQKLSDELVETNSSEALNTLSNTLYYLDTNVKDLKIAHPIGLQDCATDDCLSEVELSLSKLSLAAINQNLIAFEEIFFGESGFDKLLEYSDSSDIAADIRVALDVALSLSSEFDTLDELVAADKAMQLFEEIKKITDRLKTDFAGVLDLELPQRAEGDND